MLYDPERGLDLALAARELDAQRHVSNETAARRKVAEINAFALLDIAGSLRILAAESATYLDSTEALAATDPVDEPDEATRDFLVVGDLVHVIDDTEPGEVTRLGFDQGEAYAEVAFANGHADRFYVRNLVRIIGDEAEDEALEAVVDSTLAALNAEADGEPDISLEDLGNAILVERIVREPLDDGDGEEPVGGYELDPIEADFVEAKPKRKAKKS